VPAPARVSVSPHFSPRIVARGRPGAWLQGARRSKRHDGVLYIQENLRNKNRVPKVDPYAAIAEKNLKIMGTIDSRRIDRPGIIRMLRNKEVQRMWDEVVTHEFPLSEAEQAFQISATQQCGKILLYPHRRRTRSGDLK